VREAKLISKDSSSLRVFIKFLMQVISEILVHLKVTKPSVYITLQD